MQVLQPPESTFSLRRLVGKYNGVAQTLTSRNDRLPARGPDNYSSNHYLFILFFIFSLLNYHYQFVFFFFFHSIKENPSSRTDPHGILYVDMYVPPI